MMKLFRAWRVVGLSTLLLSAALSMRAVDPVVMTVGSDTVTLSDFMAAYRLQSESAMTPLDVKRFARSYALFRQKVCYAKDCGIDTLDSFRREYLMLSSGVDTQSVNGQTLYYDLLASVATERAVWQAAEEDTAGMTRFYVSRHNRYRWHQPRFKGYVIVAHNDSVLHMVMDYLATYPSAPTGVADSIDRRFHGKAYAWPVLAVEGQSDVVDHVAFGKSRPSVIDGRWGAFAAYEGRLIDRPETASDVRERLYPDWLAHVERKWLACIGKKYPVKINKKLLRNVK